MNAVIKLDVPEWQIGQNVTVFFPDTMQKTGVCELLKEQEEKMEHLNNITLEYEKEVFRLQTLLKEQEAVEPCNTYSTTPSGKVIPHIFCGKCNKEIYAIYAFCPFCGQAVKWE